MKTNTRIVDCNWFIVRISIFVLCGIFLFTRCSEKKSVPVSDLTSQTETTTLPYLEADFEFFTTALYHDSIFCVYRKTKDDTLFISTINGTDLVPVKKILLKDTTAFGLQYDSAYHDPLIFRRSFIINMDTIVFFNKGIHSGEASSRKLWYFVPSQDRIVVVDSFNSPDYSKTKNEDVKEMYHLSSQMFWDEGEECFIDYMNYYGMHNSKAPFLMKIFPFKDSVKQILTQTLPSCFDFPEGVVYPFYNIISPALGSNGEIYVAFGITSEMYKISNDSLYVFNVMHPNYSKPLAYTITDMIHGANGDDFVNVGERSFGYLNLVYDKYRDVLYRFYEMEMPERAENGMKNIYPDDKTMGMNVIPADFSGVQEVILNKDAYCFYYNQTPKYALPDGIYDVYFDYDSKKLTVAKLIIEFEK